jgi:hypothetical protein
MSIFEAFMMITIVVGGGFALYKLGVFRDLKPHLTLEQSVSHRPIGDDYVHIAIQVSLLNTSKVAVSITDAVFIVQQVAPLSNQEVETLYAEIFDENSETDMQWPLLNQTHKTRPDGELIIEPHGKHVEYYETIISKGITTVLVFTRYNNANYTEGDDASKGWELSTAHDVN